MCKIIQVTDHPVHGVGELIEKNCGEQVGESNVQCVAMEGNFASPPHEERRSTPVFGNPSRTVDIEHGNITSGIVRSAQEECVNVRNTANVDSQIVSESNPPPLCEPILAQSLKQDPECPRFPLVKSPVLQTNEGFLPLTNLSTLPRLTVKQSTPTGSPPGLTISPHWSPPRLELAVAEDDDMVHSSCAPSEVVHSPPRLELALTETPEASNPRPSEAEEGELRHCHVALDRVDVSASSSECTMMMQAE